MTVVAQPGPADGQEVGAMVDPRPAPRPDPVTLEGRFGRVERLDAARHGTGLWKAFSGDDRLWTYMSYGPFPDAAKFYDWLAERAKHEDPFYYVVVDRDNRAVGIAALVEIRPAMRVIEVGHIVYGPLLQRSPLATEVQYLLACYVFETLGYRRYEWKCNTLNIASRRAAERLGFTFEGVFGQHMIVKGRNRDTAWLALLDCDWPRVRSAFEQWLEPGNFDGKERQRRRLEEIRRAL
jgi:RimJ/RimL family protein N-acetyltransferase